MMSYTAAAAARYVGVKLVWLNKWRAAGLVQGQKCQNGLWEYTGAALDELAEKLAPTYAQATVLGMLWTDSQVLHRVVQRKLIIRQEFGGHARYTRESVDRVAKIAAVDREQYITVSEAVRRGATRQEVAALRAWEGRVSILNGRNLISRQRLPRGM